MSIDAGAYWFGAQIVAGILAYVLGVSAARHSRSAAELILALTVVCVFLWAGRNFIQDVLVRLFPVDLMIYVESTIIIVPFLLMAGSIGALLDDRRSRTYGPVLAIFAFSYLGMNGAWMLTPPVTLAKSNMSVTEAGVVRQSREDTCVAAALATALRAPGVNILTSESEMAELAQVRQGRGATMLRAFHAARAKLLGSELDAELLSLSARQVADIASYDRPVLVTLRSNLARTHMVAICGRTPRGQIIVADPWVESYTPLVGSVDSSGIYLMTRDEFATTYNGLAIVFVDRARLQYPSRNAL